MKILFIAPLPPPINGHSIASKVFGDDLKTSSEVVIVNLKKESLIQGVDSFKRLMEVLKIFYYTYKKKKGVDLVYFTISESLAGNIKDLVIYFLCYDLLPKMYIHLHGGGIKKLLFDRYKLILLMNKFVIGKIAGVIISGPSHINIFENIITFKKIHIVKNFAEDYLFSAEKQIIEKFSNTKPIKILYLSHMTKQKGYEFLADAFIKSNDNIKNEIRIDFVGAFDTEKNKKQFIAKIKSVEQIQYHGVVADFEKKFLFQNAHVFCLPTSCLEGQPITILEAYAAGCVVITTNQPGIRDVFTDGINGFAFSERSLDDIIRTFDKIINCRNDLLDIAMYNRKLADKQYRTSNYIKRLRAIIDMPISLDRRKD